MFKPVILLFFIASGCAALIYEVVWFQLLRLTLGASAISLGIILACFMGGMCIGSYFYHRWVSDRVHPLLAYGLLEVAIGIFGIINPLLIPAIGSLYFETTGYGYTDILLRSLITSVFLIPPAIFMGATLPAISRWVQGKREGIASIGFFYSANIAGAVLGTLLAGFFLLRLFDIYIASAVAVVINLSIGFLAIIIARKLSAATSTQQETTPAYSRNRTVSALPYIHNKTALWVIALSGVTALGAQVIWTRLLSLTFGGTVYTFSIILAVFLIGLGLGSSFAAKVIQRLRNPALLLMATQLLLVPAIWWANYAINELLPNILLFGTNSPEIKLISNWGPKSLNDLLRTGITILPATILWGASFPLALCLSAGQHKDSSQFTGRVYAANTLGAVVGALVFSAAMIPLVGTHGSQASLIIIALCSGLLLLKSSATKSAVATPTTDSTGHSSQGFKIAISGVGLCLITLASLFLLTPLNNALVAYGRIQHHEDVKDFTVVAEGINTSVVVSKIKRGPKNQLFNRLHVGGKVVASNLPFDMRTQRQLGHLPALIHKNPESVLIIGFGAGVTAGTFTLYDSIKRIVIVEIEPLVPQISSKYFRNENYDVYNDPRTEVIIDDGRHFIATTDEKFDIISTDPIHPWFKGASSLYTREFYDKVKAHLNPGGLVTQWVPFYETDEAAAKSQVGTFFDAFPLASVWNTQPSVHGYDVTLLGTVDPLKINADDFISRVKHNPELPQSLAEVGVRNVNDMILLYTGGQTDIQNWLSDAQLNLDRNMRLEYLAGTSLDMQVATRTYLNMVKNTSYPFELFDFNATRTYQLQRYFDQKNRAMQELREKQAAGKNN